MSLLPDLIPLDFDVRAVPAPSDPPAYVYTVELRTERGVWRETLASAEHLRAYCRGVQALASLLVPRREDSAEVPVDFDHPLVKWRLLLHGLRERCEEVVGQPTRYPPDPA